MDPRTRFRLLYVYLGAYLHEDWMYEFPDPQSAYDSYLDVVETAELPQLLAEFDDLLGLTGGAFVEAFDRLSRNLTPSKAFGWDERQWLHSLRDRAAAELAARSDTGT
jgi:hypothetical protein